MSWNSYILCWKQALFVFRLVLVIDRESTLFIEDQAFSRPYDLGSSLTLPSLFRSASSTNMATHKKTEKVRQVGGGREGGGKGAGEEPEHTTARKPGPL
jgi:hypothetical protein